MAGRLALRSCRMSEVQPEAVTFPLRKLTLLEGNPGQGKSCVTAAIAACGSLGRGLPVMESFEPFRSLFLSAEGGKADTLRPRLDALSAVVERPYAYDHPPVPRHLRGNVRARARDRGTRGAPGGHRLGDVVRRRAHR
jgi:hypothetical protein